MMDCQRYDFDVAQGATWFQQLAYEKEADPMFFMAQRGEITQEEYLAKMQEIKDRYPYYYDADGNLL